MLNARLQRQKRVRAKLIGTSEKPRLSVFRSSKQIYAQLVDDANGKTIASARSYEVKEEKSDKHSKDLKAKTLLAYNTGKLLAKKAQEKGVTKVIFDRGSYLYHGRVEALAKGARKGGLNF
ncbi:MAG: 50S ribosomal protein L18 [Candidatus Nealsonbacteria bacterium]|nr:50S ribosomal protein L18 [Candidatus Nealsonbacteria bacterium]